MAAKRIAQSSIDWMKFAERVPENQRHMYQLFKAKSDAYLSKVLSLPENPPKFDWQKYRTRIGASTLVDQFEKEYTALKIPYPKENVIPEIDAQEQQAKKDIVEFVQDSKNRIEKIKAELVKWDNMIPFEHMTMEDYSDAFPETAHDPINRPTFWPHTPDEQPGYEDSDKPTH